jgi:exopolysaccharide biosynthesis polyprenyl glycosylphosphotransferase
VRPATARAPRHTTEVDRSLAIPRAAENLRRHAFRAARDVGALLIVDAIAFVAARAMLLAVERGQFSGGLALSSLAHELGGSGVAFAMALLVGTTVAGTYRPGDARRHVGRLCLAAAIASALPLWSRVWSQAPVDALQTGLLVFAPLCVALVVARTTFDAIARRWPGRSGARTRARVILVGTANDCLVRQKGTSPDHVVRFDVLGFIDIAGHPNRRALGSLADLESVLLEQDADTVVLCGLPSSDTTSRVLRAAAVAECKVIAAAPQLELPGVRPTLIKQGGQPLLELRPVVLRAEQLVLKRALDIVGGTVILVVLAPLLAILAALVVLDSPGPALFCQRRLGRFGRPIRCLKFRSMDVNAEARLKADPVLFRQYVEHDYKLPASIDTRITRVGHFLRRTSLDELPQLWNVLKGEMSLVGPRPIVPDEIHHYNGEGPLLLSLKPGMTGAWQVMGRSAVAYPARVAVELDYVEGWSLWRDLSILVRTVPAVLGGRGAY